MNEMHLIKPLSLRQKVGLISAALFFIFGFLYYVILIPKQKALTTLMQQCRDKEMLLQKIPPNLVEASETHSLEETNAEAWVITHHFQQAELIASLTTQAKKSGVVLHTIRILPSQTQSPVIVWPMELVIYGKFHPILLFVEQLTTLSQMVTVHDFVIQSHAQKGKESQRMFHVTLKAYQWKKE